MRSVGTHGPFVPTLLNKKPNYHEQNRNRHERTRAATAGDHRLQPRERGGLRRPERGDHRRPGVARSPRGLRARQRGHSKPRRQENHLHRGLREHRVQLLQLRHLHHERRRQRRQAAHPDAQVRKQPPLDRGGQEDRLRQLRRQHRETPDVHHQRRRQPAQARLQPPRRRKLLRGRPHRRQGPPRLLHLRRRQGLHPLRGPAPDLRPRRQRPHVQALGRVGYRDSPSLPGRLLQRRSKRRGQGRARRPALGVPHEALRRRRVLRLGPRRQ